MLETVEIDAGSARNSREISQLKRVNKKIHGSSFLRLIIAHGLLGKALK